MSSIYGNGKPRFQGTGTPDSTIRDLEHAIRVDPQNNTIDDFVEQKSPRATGGDRDFQYFGYYSEFTYRVLLFKYADPEATFNLLNTYRSQDVYFTPNNDKSYLQKATSGNALFTVTQILPTFLDEYGDKEVALITFRSKNYIAL